jgi:potassium channel LctB
MGIEVGTEPDYGRLRGQAAGRLKEKSVIAFAIERAFRALQWLSPGSRLGKRATDLYILGWLVLGMALGLVTYAFYPALPFWLRAAVLLAAALRILDVTQAVVNVGVFDHLQSDAPQEVESVVRSLVLLVWNFAELMAWFGLVYLPLAFLQENKGFWSTLYFSGITQLTIGYGDLTPIGTAKAVAVLQGSLSWVVSVIIIGRFVGALPSIREPKRKRAAKQPPEVDGVRDGEAARSAQLMRVSARTRHLEEASREIEGTVLGEVQLPGQQLEWSQGSIPFLHERGYRVQGSA